MSWTHVLIFWLVVAVGVLAVSNWWLRFTVDALKKWQSGALLALSRHLRADERIHETEEDDVLDSDLIN